MDDDWKWVEEGNLFKLGTPFGLKFNPHDMGQFIHTKISRKPEYWSIMKLSFGRQGGYL